MGAAEIKQRLGDYHTFLSLLEGLFHGQYPQLQYLTAQLIQIQASLNAASAKELKTGSKPMEESLVKTVEFFSKILPPKKGIRNIAQDFALLRKTEDVEQRGIPFDWLQERFECSGHQRFIDLPRHARVGIGIHSRGVSIEDSTLLADSFFLLVQARECYEKLMQTKKEAVSYSQDIYNSLNSLNKSVCTFSRLGVLTAASFVEAFVNFVGWNQALSGSGFSEKELLTLKGLDNRGRFLKLEKKLEEIPLIIRRDQKRPIVISDNKQIREPFASYLSTTKDVRNSSMHFAPGKAAIIRSPQEWLQLMEDAASQSVGVAREFWSACFPRREQPLYLENLITTVCCVRLLIGWPQ